MKRCLHQAIRFTVISLCCFLTFGNSLNAQNYFSLTDITISPPAPTNYDMVSVSLSGLRQDSCTQLNFFDAGVLLYDLDIQMDWDSAANPICNGSMIPWDTTIVLGFLPDGDYVIDLMGTNYTNDSGDPLNFVVTESAAGVCGSSPVIWVTSAEDDGPGTLREAISCANTNANASNILFDIAGGGVHEIRVGETTGLPLPTITGGGITIDATTQPGYGTDGPLILITGRFGAFSTLVSGLRITGNDAGIFGLDISSFPDNGILIDGAQSVEIGKPNNGNTITLNGVGFDNVTVPNNYNIGTGIRLINGASDCTIQDNHIGTNEFGGEILGNQFCGIFIQADCDNNTIGGTAPDEGNVIAYNANGLRVEGTAEFNEFARNQFECNDSIAIKNMNGANGGQVAPVFLEINYNEISGGAAPGDRVDVYFIGQQCVGAPCQGKVFLGAAIADVMGEWSLSGPFATGDTLTGGEIITAIATSTSGSSSEFADCSVTVGLSDCTDSDGAIWVTNTQDTGVGSLREALICADTTVGANTIKFNIPGTGPFTIFVGETSGQSLPALTDPGTIIDGSTQPGYGAGGNYTPQIILSGAMNTWNTPDDALQILANYSEIYALEIVDFPDDAIEVLDAVHVMIGAPQKGNVIYNNGSTIDQFPGAPGQGPFEGSGIALRGTSKRITIASNFIGTDYSQTSTAGNEYCGIYIGYDIDFVNIGGTSNRGNVIANNAEGIRVLDESFGINMRRNSFICNDSVAIRLEGVASGAQLPPSWDMTSETSLTSLSGKADGGDVLIEIYRVDNNACANAPCQGKTYLGTANVSNNEWTLNAPFANGVTLSNGDLLVATAIDQDANTSEFSECHIAANCALTATGIGIVNANCNLPNGSFTIATSGGPAPFTYDMGLGQQASPTFTGLPAGIYNITVTDAYTCPAIATVIITDPGIPTSSPQLLEPETCDMQNGFIILNQASGGVGPYAYNIGSGNQFNNPNFINLAAGDYDVTITDANGCTGVAPVTLPFIEGPTLSVASINNETCTQANGSFTLNTSSGTPMFSYNIGGASQNNPLFIGLEAGTYVATVTDDNGCTDSESISLINVPGPSSLSIVSTTPDFCGQESGTVTVDPVGGTAPYLYDIGFGIETSNFFANLAAGTYTITATDINQCIITVDATIPSVDGASLSLASSSDANCGQATGSVTINASGGTGPYIYNLGNGNQASPIFNNLLAGGYEVSVTDNNNCITTLPFTINDLGGPVPGVASLTDATCEQANGSVTIVANGGVSPFLYDIGNGNTANAILTGLAGGNYDVTVTDAAGCSGIVPVTIGNSGLQPVAGFTYTENNGTVSFTSTSQNAGVYDWDFGNGGASSADNPIHTYFVDGTYNACLTVINDCGQDTYCETITILTTVNVSGIIEKENGVPVSTVKIYFGGANPTINAGDGTYSVSIQSGLNATILPEKDTLYGNGVSGFDVFKIQQHILFVELLDSPYKIISADVNRSNTVTTFDTYLMQQVILQNQDTFPNNTSWRFVEKAFTFPNPANPFATSFPELLVYNNPSANITDADFIAMKIGDVNLNANPAFVDDDPENKMQLLLDDPKWEDGAEIKLPVRAKDLNQLAVLQFGFDFDSRILKFEGITAAGLSGLDENDFNIKNADRGELSLLWYDKTGIGQKVDVNTVLFYLNFKAKAAGQMSEVLSIAPCRNRKSAYDADGQEWLVNAVFAKAENSTPVASTYKMMVQPNPFQTHVDVLLESAESTTGEITIYDLSGRLVHTEKVLLEKGHQQVRLSRAVFGAKGIYLLQVKTGGFVETKRVLMSE